jgi:predicted protein tyrosine phosphatase
MIVNDQHEEAVQHRVQAAVAAKRVVMMTLDDDTVHSFL